MARRSERESEFPSQREVDERASDPMQKTSTRKWSTRAASHELAYVDELKRKALHLVALVIPLGIWLAGSTLALAVCASAATLALSADVLRVRSHGFAAFVYRHFGFMMRPEECPPVGGPMVLNGATWVLISATLLVAVFPQDVAVVSFTTFMVADAAAAVIGRRFGRRLWPRTFRTVEGSTAFFVAGLAVVLLFGWTPLWGGVLAVSAGTAAEIPSLPLNDNVRVPLVMGIVLYASGAFAA